MGAYYAEMSAAIENLTVENIVAENEKALAAFDAFTATHV